MIEEEDLLYEEVNDTTTWSVSSLKSLGSCGRQWKFRYVDHAEAAKTPYLEFGSVIHQVIEEIHKSNDWTNWWERRWSTLWSEAANGINWDDFKGPKKMAFNTSGTKMLIKYVDNPQNREAEILEVENRFPSESEVYKIGKFTIRGVIDQVRRTKGGRLLVVDFKTSKYPLDPLVLRADPQFTFYWSVVKKKYNEDPLLALYHLESGKMLYTSRDEGDVEMVEKMLQEGQMKVDAQMFERNIGIGCRYCPFVQKCLGPVGNAQP